MRRTLRLSVLITTLLFVLGGQQTSAQTRASTAVQHELHRAELAWQQGASVWEAKARVDRVLAEHPADPDALRLRAHIRLAQQDGAGAFEDARRAVAARPDPDGHALLAETALAAGDTLAATAALEAAATALLNRPETHYPLALLAERAGAANQAEAYARVAHLAEPTAGTYLLLARLLVAQNRDRPAAILLAQGVMDGMLRYDGLARDSALTHLTRLDVLREAAR